MGDGSGGRAGGCWLFAGLESEGGGGRGVGVEDGVGCGCGLGSHGGEEKAGQRETEGEEERNGTSECAK